jgi:hypothetical protein
MAIAVGPMKLLEKWLGSGRISYNMALSRSQGLLMIRFTFRESGSGAVISATVTSASGCFCLLPLSSVADALRTRLSAEPFLSAFFAFLTWIGFLSMKARFGGPAGTRLLAAELWTEKTLTLAVRSRGFLQVLTSASAAMLVWFIVAMLVWLAVMQEWSIYSTVVLWTLCLPPFFSIRLAIS